MHAHLCVVSCLSSSSCPLFSTSSHRSSFQPFLMFTSALNERSRSNPLCDFRLGTVVTSDYETPLTTTCKGYPTDPDDPSRMWIPEPHPLPRPLECVPRAAGSSSGIVGSGRPPLPKHRNGVLARKLTPSGAQNFGFRAPFSPGRGPARSPCRRVQLVTRPRALHVACVSWQSYTTLSEGFASLATASRPCHPSQAALVPLRADGAAVTSCPRVQTIGAGWCH